MKSEFEVGDIVEWSSQARGSVTKKQGEVVYKNNADKFSGLVTPVSRAAKDFPGHMRMFDGLNFEKPYGYFVSVPGGTTSKAKPKLYMPKVSGLRLVKKGNEE